MLAGEPEQAARLWAEPGCPYESALALVDSEDDVSVRRGLEELPAAGRAAYSRDRRAQPPPAAACGICARGRTRRRARAPSGLTARELDVLRLVATGMRNSQIAERLVVSPKTVDHHVSADPAKLGVKTRTEAAARANRLGIIEK